MPLTGFPDQIIVTLGTGWAGETAALTTGQEHTLNRIGATDVWSKDGTNTPHTTNNPIKYEPVDGGGSGIDTIYVNDSAGMSGGDGTWYSLGSVSDTVTGDYDFKELWTANSGGTFPNWEPYLDGELLSIQEIFSAMDAGGTNVTATPSAIALANTINAPTITAGANYTASAIAIGLTMPSAAVSAGASLAASAIALSFTVPDVTVAATGAGDSNSQIGLHVGIGF